MNLSQAAQFDGETNGKIESVALMAWNHGMSYKDYRAYADAAQTTALNHPEYQAICNSWGDMDALVKECAHRIQVHGINEDFEQLVRVVIQNAPFNEAIQDAVFTGTGAFSVHVDENDQILVEHWDSNILFNQRNHTE